MGIGYHSQLALVESTPQHGLASDTDTASPDNDDDQDTVSYKPGEIVLRWLQVTVDERAHIHKLIN